MARMSEKPPATLRSENLVRKISVHLLRSPNRWVHSEEYW